VTSVQTSQVRRFGLSKSKLTTFEQCPRRLWQQTHAPERGEVDEEQQARMAVGHTVGDIACGLFPDGVMVDADEGLNVSVETTRHLIEEGHPGPIFEATFEHDGVLIRADVLSRDGRDGWHMAEVKSSARVKDYHLGDLATQVWVLGKAGLKVSGAAIRHIDTSFVLEREGDFAGLFADTDCLAQIADAVEARTQLWPMLALCWLEMNLTLSQATSATHLSLASLGPGVPEISHRDRNGRSTSCLGAGAQNGANAVSTICSTLKPRPYHRSTLVCWKLLGPASHSMTWRAPGPPWRNGVGRAHGSISKPSILPSHAGWAPVLTSKCRSSSLCTWSEVMARSRTMSF
jgi:hypothetical protein